ncbi:MAG: pyridoxamine 5'-phosphate oxidase family protein [Bacteroidales bacterium]
MRVKKITDESEILGVIKKCRVCALAMVDKQNHPYVVPMNFGLHNGDIYFHGAQGGRKMEILKSNPQVAVNFTADHKLRYQNEHVACSYSMKYRSVIVEGEVEFIDDKAGKIKALDIIMGQYTKGKFNYNDPAIREVAIFRLSTKKITGRKMHY